MNMKRKLTGFLSKFSLNNTQNGNELIAATDQPVAMEKDIKITIDQSWSDNNGVGLSGWMLGKGIDFDDVEASVGNVSVPVETWTPRPDLQPFFPQYDTKEKSGFFVYIPRQLEYEAVFQMKAKNKCVTVPIKVRGSKPVMPVDYDESVVQYFGEFIRRVNEEKLHVMEIGSRIVSPGSVSKRSLFENAASFTGFDYYADSNTDVTGDAHTLSKHFNQRFDAIFSLAVLEHIAMPWLVAKEINKLLPMGGITYHSTVFAWPRHESPWDFWRFSDDGLKVLFSPAMGFEIIRAGLSSPLRMYFDKIPTGQEQFPLHPGFAECWIMARKVAEIDEDKARWDFSLNDVLGHDSRYPFR